MDENASGGDSDDIDWNTDDELEIASYGLPSCSSMTVNDGETIAGSTEASSSAGSSSSKMIDHFVGMGFSEEVVAKAIQENGEQNTDLILEALLKHSASSSASSSKSKLIDHFVGMGFSVDMVAKAIQENGEEKTDSILETLLTYSALGQSSQAEQHINSDQNSPELDGSFLDGFSDTDSFEGEEITNPDPDKEEKLVSLASMGYSVQEASIAMERCGPNTSIAELTDFICAAQMAKAADALLAEIEDKPRPKPSNGYHKHKKRRMLDYEKPPIDEPIRLPNPMIGFGVPSNPDVIVHRSLPEAAAGPPYFYYENVALAPKGVWDTISRFLYDVEPEFVDSKYFCAAARKRGYVHNLPIENRHHLVPLPPQNIYEALPLSRKWWPSWDTRSHLNCLQTCIASAKLTERIRKALEECDGEPEPPHHVQKFVMDECRKWNLVWVGRNKLAPLEPDEVEMLLGFPKNHTRGGGISRTDRYKSLGNSFQVDTVAYHLSVLKEMYPDGINVLSLFSGIGGAEVALHRLGVRMKNVVSVDISEVNRNIVRSWWEQTNQKGTLIDFADVQQLDANRIEQMINAFGGFDLVIGGSPCNNLAGSNRHSRDGLEGKESSLFYDYFRILDLVKNMMQRN
ncbi:hypothetical protein WN944_009841 [Citrus x changshan-huyou]|uniref:DNA (Cytosine-5)-methyltransferase DRM2 n=4 Tax=Citrus TaxID=2706 RepID=A0ACB8MYV5_CITSI|nr:DNA (cytosine-5)-methyltransferase DRM2 [Citrus sinensis]